MRGFAMLLGFIFFIIPSLLWNMLKDALGFGNQSKALREVVEIENAIAEFSRAGGSLPATASSITWAISMLRAHKFYGPYDIIGDYVVQITPDVICRANGKVVVRSDMEGNIGICRLLPGTDKTVTGIDGMIER